MSEVLSQNEIDSLLSALSAGEMNADELKKEEEEKKVKVYDFKRALRFSKDQIRSLTRIHENYARLLTTFLSAQLRTYVDINVASVEQLPYEEFIRSVPTMTVLNVFEAPPLEGRLLIEVNPNVAYAMLDRMLGGTGESVNKVNNLTDIETNLMSQIFTRTLDTFQEAWSSVIDIEPEMLDFEVNPQFLQMVSPNETVIVVSFNLTIGETTGMINICLPHVVLEPIIPKLSMHYWMQTTQKEHSEEEVHLLKEKIKTTKVPVIAELGQSTITVNEFLNLGVNDVIKLNQRIDDPVIVRVGQDPKYSGQVGKQHNNMAVQILELLDNGEEDHDE